MTTFWPMKLPTRVASCHGTPISQAIGASTHPKIVCSENTIGLPADAADKMPSDLSGGMIKRVALARALIMDPPLLLLDEPTAGLDPASADSFCEFLLSLHKGMGLTVVMVTHDLDTIFELSTRIAVLAA